MRLLVNSQNLIAVENAKKEDVDFVIVDGVFFERKKDQFCNITNDNKTAKDSTAKFCFNRKQLVNNPFF